MTTYDPKYKHKPSEKHTLEEVLKSLQDMIRNDLLDNDQAAVPAEKSRPGTASSTEQLHRERATPVREDFAPLTPNTGPVNLDAVMRSLNDLISNELNADGKPTPEKETTPSPPEQSTTDLNVSEEYVPLDEELSFEDSAEPIVGNKRAPADETAPPVEQRLTGEDVVDEFVPLDEELIIEGPLEIAPNPPTEDALPELPGEISPELLKETDVEIPPPPPLPEGGENIASGPQQEFLLQGLPPRDIEYEPLTQDSAQEPEPEPTPEAKDHTAAITGEPASQAIQGAHDEALPTIEVEETFDESAYFDVAGQQEENQPTEIQEIQEIIATALGTPAETEPSPLPASPVPSEEQKSDQNLTSTPESAVTPETELKEAPPDTGVTLDIVDEPTAVDPNLSSVDFDTIDLEPLKDGQAPSATTSEAPAPENNQPPATVEAPTAPEAPHETLTVSNEPAPTVVDAENKPETKPEKPPDPQAAKPGSRKSRKTEPGSKHKPFEPSPSSSIDDIPVLKDVVAPPAGSTLVSEPASPRSEARLPTPDRARNIVVRAVAKLNVEMRKSGGTGIDTKTILRLQKLIQQELEKDGEK